MNNALLIAATAALEKDYVSHFSDSTQEFATAIREPSDCQDMAVICLLGTLRELLLTRLILLNGESGQCDLEDQPDSEFEQVFLDYLTSQPSGDVESFAQLDFGPLVQPYHAWLVERLDETLKPEIGKGWLKGQDVKDSSEEFGVNENLIKRYRRGVTDVITMKSWLTVSEAVLSQTLSDHKYQTKSSLTSLLANHLSGKFYQFARYCVLKDGACVYRDYIATLEERHAWAMFEKIETRDAIGLAAKASATEFKEHCWEWILDQVEMLGLKQMRVAATEWIKSPTGANDSDIESNVSVPDVRKDLLNELRERRFQNDEDILMRIGMHNLGKRSTGRKDLQDRVENVMQSTYKTSYVTEIGDAPAFDLPFAFAFFARNLDRKITNSLRVTKDSRTVRSGDLEEGLLENIACRNSTWSEREFDRLEWLTYHANTLPENERKVILMVAGRAALPSEREVVEELKVSRYHAALALGAAKKRLLGREEEDA